MGRAAIAERTTARAADLAPVLATLNAECIISMGAIARGLTARRIPTSEDATTWSPMHRSLGC